jgi:hypothetical protein
MGRFEGMTGVRLGLAASHLLLLCTVGAGGGCAANAATTAAQPIEVPPPRPDPEGNRPPLILATDPLERDILAELEGDVAQEPCASAGRWRSEDNGIPLFLDFQNDTPRTLSMFWLDFDGRRVHYADLPPGQGYRQQTFATHPWMAVDGDGQCRALLVPLAAGHHAVVLRAR